MRKKKTLPFTRVSFFCKGNFLQAYFLGVHMSDFVVQWNSHVTKSLETGKMCNCNTGNVFSGRCSTRFIITSGVVCGVFVI